MRENKYHNGRGWEARELFGEDRYSSAGKHTWEDTVEIRIRTDIDIMGFITMMAVKKFLVMNKVLNGSYEYMFAYVPVGTAEDFVGSLANEMKRINKNRGLENKSDERDEEPDFTKMYLDFESKFNPYPVQMSRADAFGHAYRAGLITKEVYDKARNFYGSLWNYTGD